MSDRKYFSGDTLAQALNQAARHFDIEPDEVQYRTVDKRHGFLKLRRRVLIEVDERAPRVEGAVLPPVVPAAPEPISEAVSAAAERAPEPSAPAAAETGPPPAAAPEPHRDGARGVVSLPEAPRSALDRFPAAEGEEAEAAREALDRILSVSSLELEAVILQGEERLEIELWGADQDILLRDRGRLLLAVQHLMPRAIRGILGRSVTCRVDSDSFHEIRAERLRDLAQRAANEVRDGRRSKTLEPMSPDERRIVHLTLADDPSVETESHGDGLFKRVVVSPTQQRKPRGFDPYRR